MPANPTYTFLFDRRSLTLLTLGIAAGGVLLFVAGLSIGLHWNLPAETTTAGLTAQELSLLGGGLASPGGTGSGGTDPSSGQGGDTSPPAGAPADWVPLVPPGTPPADPGIGSGSGSGSGSGAESDGATSPTPPEGSTGSSGSDAGPGTTGAPGTAGTAGAAGAAGSPSTWGDGWGDIREGEGDDEAWGPTDDWGLTAGAEPATSARPGRRPVERLEGVRRAATDGAPPRPETSRPGPWVMASDDRPGDERGDEGEGRDRTEATEPEADREQRPRRETATERGEADRGRAADRPVIFRPLPPGPAPDGPAEPAQPAASRPPAPRETAEPGRETGPSYAFQVAAFGVRENAERLLAELSASGYPAYFAPVPQSGGSSLTAVRVGPYPSRPEAAAAAAEFARRRGTEPFVVRQ